MSGSKAVRNGNAFEARIFNILNSIPGVRIIKNIPYPSIYSIFTTKHKTKMEFRAENITLTYPTLDPTGNTIHKTRIFKTLNIECKYQEKQGSIDEKYPLVAQNSFISDAEATLFVYADPNNKIKSGAIEYIRHTALNSGERLIVLDDQEFDNTIITNYAGSLANSNSIERLAIADNVVAEYETLNSKHRNAFYKCIGEPELEEQYVNYLAKKKEFYFFINNYGIKAQGYLTYVNDLQKIRSIFAKREAQILHSDV